MFKTGHNCWKVHEGTDGAFVIDGENYFRELYSILPRARRTIYIAGWDMDSRVRLVRGEKSPLPVGLAGFLDRLAGDNPDLEVYLLNWDFSSILAMHREKFPRLKFGFKTGPRVHFRLDGRHPIGASHHQKLVIVDDRIAWCGGIDLTAYRWDTRDHKKGDRRRTTPYGTHYGPFHDMMMRVRGGVARDLGELFRERWKRATGEEPAAPETAAAGLDNGDDLRWDFEGARVAVARTRPEYESQQEVREVEQMYLDLVDAASRSIYLENQYLTSRTIGERIMRSLASPEGPEVVIVQSREYNGWLGERVMGMLRNRLALDMKGQDHAGRLGLYYPHCPLDEDEVYTLHSKCMIVDDRFVRIGSANLNNRSMGLDTECDLVLDAGEDHGIREVVRTLRADLLSEHTGLDRESILADMEGGATLKEIIASGENRQRRLQPLEPHEENVAEELVETVGLFDPERPLESGSLAEKLLGDEAGDDTDEGSGATGVLVLLVLLLVLVPLAWYFTPLRDWLTREEITRFFTSVGGTYWSWPAVLGVYVLGSLVFVPLNLLIIATATVFGTIEALLFILAGGLLGAMAGYGVGRSLGRRRVENLMPGRLKAAARKISRRGFVSVLLVRIFPVAPNTSINLLAGAIRIPFRDYLLGTLLGLLPGAVSLTLFQRSLVSFLKNPDPAGVAVLVGIGGLITAAYLFLQKRYGGRNGRETRSQA